MSNAIGVLTEIRFDVGFLFRFYLDIDGNGNFHMGQITQDDGSVERRNITVADQIAAELLIVFIKAPRQYLSELRQISSCLF